MRNSIGLVLLLLSACTPLLAQSPDALQALLDSHQVFALRDAVRSNPHAPLLYRGAVQASLNHIRRARRDLTAVIKADPHSRQAYDAHQLFATLYFRNGSYHAARAELEAAHALHPDAADVNNLLPLFRTLSQSPDMRVVHRDSTNILRVGAAHRILPVEINGQHVAYGFDTGAGMSVMGASEARRLGLVATRVDGKLGESSGSDIQGYGVAVARDVVVAGLHLQNVPFFVLDDSGEPLVRLPAGLRGFIGIPVLIAMQTIRWDSPGWFATGHSAQQGIGHLQNLLFSAATPVVEARVQNTTLSFSFDTGAADTVLNEIFANEFPALVKAGTKEKRPILGMGGKNTYDAVLLHPLMFHLGGRDVTLASPHVFVSHSLGTWDGNLGDDILNQVTTVTLDFRSMSLTLH